MVRESVAHLKMAGKEVMLDLEHFFDGYKANAEYTMQVGIVVHTSMVDARSRPEKVDVAVYASEIEQ